MKVAIAQIAPVWMDRAGTLAKVEAAIREAGSKGARLVAFGEAVVPGYPFWVDRTDGARFGSAVQEQWFARYVDQAVTIECGDLDGVCEAAREANCAVYLGVIERPDRRTSVHASMVYISPAGEIGSVHRKVRPTYEERLVWSPGDGHGLRTHELDEFRVGGLNCWENWMPLARAALYADGETFHVMIWPGSVRNTAALTPVVAVEGRSYVLSVSGIFRPSDIPAGLDLPEIDALRADTAPNWADGGSCLAAPDGTWVLEPLPCEEGVFVAEASIEQVLRARHNFDPSGHYSRPDVLKLSVNRERLGPAHFED